MKNALRIGIPATFMLLLILVAMSIRTVDAQTITYGSGWQVTYFSDTNFANAVLASVDDQINEAYGTGAPAAVQAFNFPTDNFSVRWTGLQNFANSGTYRFTASADDGVRVTIDGSVVIDDLTQTGSLSTRTAEVNITAGTRDIRVDFVEFSGNAAVQFFWEPIEVATDGPSPTPTATGLPPIPPGALTATVIRANVLNVRDAPSLGGNVMGRILRGQTYQVVGRNENATWFVLQLGGYRGWVYGYYLFINGNEFNPPVIAATSLFPIPAGFNDTGVLVQVKAGMRLRSEPSVFAPQTGRITWGSFLPVSGRTAGGDWYQVLWKGTVGWVFTGYLDIVQGEYANIPVIE